MVLACVKSKLLWILVGVVCGLLFYRYFIEKSCPECPPTSVVTIGKQKNKGSGTLSSTITQKTNFDRLFSSDSLIAARYVKSLSNKDWRRFKSKVR